MPSDLATRPSRTGPVVDVPGWRRGLRGAAVTERHAVGGRCGSWSERGRRALRSGARRVARLHRPCGRSGSDAEGPGGMRTPEGPGGCDAEGPGNARRRRTRGVRPGGGLDGLRALQYLGGVRSAGAAGHCCGTRSAGATATGRRAVGGRCGNCCGTRSAGATATGRSAVGRGCGRCAARGPRRLRSEADADTERREDGKPGGRTERRTSGATGSDVRASPQAANSTGRRSAWSSTISPGSGQKRMRTPKEGRMGNPAVGFSTMRGVSAPGSCASSV